MSALSILAMLTLSYTATFAGDAAPAVNLIDGLESGRIWAQFYGGGDRGVNGIIGREPDGPNRVNIEPGTQFWAQTAGRQGQTALGGRSVNLGGQQYRQVWIPAACTNINRPPPTPDHRMFAYRCPSDDMAKLCSLPSLTRHSRPAIQVAVWAIANDPAFARLQSYLHESTRRSQRQLSVDSIMHGAADLLTQAGLQPSEFRMFR